MCHRTECTESDYDEIEAFGACISWARKKCEENVLDATNAANLRTALGEAIFKIRFCSMSHEQFAGIDKAY